MPKDRSPRAQWCKAVKAYFNVVFSSEIHHLEEVTGK